MLFELNTRKSQQNYEQYWEIEWDWEKVWDTKSFYRESWAKNLNKVKKQIIKVRQDPKAWSLCFSNFLSPLPKTNFQRVDFKPFYYCLQFSLVLKSGVAMRQLINKFYYNKHQVLFYVCLIKPVLGNWKQPIYNGQDCVNSIDCTYNLLHYSVINVIIIFSRFNSN